MRQWAWPKKRARQSLIASLNRMRKNNLIQFIIILGLLQPAAAFCETITLKSGKQIEGRIMEETDQYIKIESNGMPIYYELKYVQNIEENKRDAKFYLKEGFKCTSEGKFSQAEEEFKKGLGVDSANHNLKEALKMIDDLKSGAINKEYAVYLFKGSDYLINAKYQEAVAEFKEALKVKPYDSDLYYYLGVCYYSLEQYLDAISYLKKAAEIKPNEEIYYYLGVCYYSLGHFPEAINYLTKTLEASPDDAEVYSIIGTSYYLSGQSQPARENLNKARELFQKNNDYLKAKDIEEFLGTMK